MNRIKKLLLPLWLAFLTISIVYFANTTSRSEPPTNLILLSVTIPLVLAGLMVRALYLHLILRSSSGYWRKLEVLIRSILAGFTGVPFLGTATLAKRLGSKKLAVRAVLEDKLIVVLSTSFMGIFVLLGSLASPSASFSSGEMVILLGGVALMSVAGLMIRCAPKIYPRVLLVWPALNYKLKKYTDLDSELHSRAADKGALFFSALNGLMSFVLVLFVILQQGDVEDEVAFQFLFLRFIAQAIGQVPLPIPPTILREASYGLLAFTSGASVEIALGVSFLILLSNLFIAILGLFAEFWRTKRRLVNPD